MFTSAKRSEGRLVALARVLACALALSAWGCSSSVGGDGGIDVSPGTDVPSGTDAASDASSGTPCPADPPANGAACAREGLVCEYGNDPRINCRTTATCTSGAFQVGLTGCPPPAQDMCPATREAAAGQTCAVTDAYCSYGDLHCHCTDCPRGAPVCGPGSLRWDCDVPNPDPTCPTALPRRGAACTAESQRCVYQCGAGGARECRGGAWFEAEGGPCPMSTRRVKRDIRYLADDEVATLAREALRTRLTTYEYTDPVLAGRRRLGFIIEDQPASSYAVERDRTHVDLYGYTSMVLAASQAQERRIAELERELAVLRAEVRAQQQQRERRR